MCEAFSKYLQKQMAIANDRGILMIKNISRKNTKKVFAFSQSLSIVTTESIDLTVEKLKSKKKAHEVRRKWLQINKLPNLGAELKCF